jgi:hypothetical protein
LRTFGALELLAKCDAKEQCLGLSQGDTMGRRMMISVAILVGVGLAIFFGGRLVHSQARIDVVSFERIKSGLTQREVEKIIGAVPGDYGVGTGVVLWNDLHVFDETFVEMPATKKWLGQKNAICVTFDVNGKSFDRAFPKVYREHDSNFDRLIGIIGLTEKKALTYVIPTK